MSCWEIGLIRRLCSEAQGTEVRLTEWNFLCQPFQGKRFESIGRRGGRGTLDAVKGITKRIVLLTGKRALSAPSVTQCGSSLSHSWPWRTPGTPCPCSSPSTRSSRLQQELLGEQGPQSSWRRKNNRGRHPAAGVSAGLLRVCEPWLEASAPPCVCKPAGTMARALV